METGNISTELDEGLFRVGTKVLFVKPTIWGALAGFSLLSLYFLILALANSTEHALDEFLAIWYWIVPLVVGFGIQAGFFAYTKYAGKVLGGRTAASSMAVSGGISTTSMAACCAHHLTDVLPLLGASAAAVFLTRFQSSFMTVGIFSNLAGILVMLSIIKKGSLFHERQRLLSSLVKLDLRKAIIAVIVAGVLVTGISVYVTL